MPVWFITPGTMLVALWHREQAWVVGKWLAGLVVVPPLPALNVLVDVWQVEQPAAMPLWFIIPGTKLTALWHSEQACVVGRWLLGLVVPVAVLKLVVEVWQVEQSAVVGRWLAGLATGVTPVNF